MNGKQAARAAAKRIKELEYVNAMQSKDIADYNACILSMISGDSACLWCEERPECQLKVKEAGRGCSEWWLRYRDQGGDPDGEAGEKTGETDLAVQRVEEQ